MKNDPLKAPLISKQCLEYMGTPIAEKVEDFNLYSNAKRTINEKKGMAMLDVQI